MRFLRNGVDPAPQIVPVSSRTYGAEGRYSGQSHAATRCYQISRRDSRCTALSMQVFLSSGRSPPCQKPRRNSLVDRLLPYSANNAAPTGGEARLVAARVVLPEPLEIRVEWHQRLDGDLESILRIRVAVRTGYEHNWSARESRV